MYIYKPLIFFRVTVRIRMSSIMARLVSPGAAEYPCNEFVSSQTARWFWGWWRNHQTSGCSVALSGGYYLN